MTLYLISDSSLSISFPLVKSEFQIWKKNDFKIIKVPVQEKVPGRARHTEYWRSNFLNKKMPNGMVMDLTAFIQELAF